MLNDEIVFDVYQSMAPIVMREEFETSDVFTDDVEGISQNAVEDISETFQMCFTFAFFSQFFC